MNAFYHTQLKNLKLKDDDIQPFLKALQSNTIFKGEVNLSGHELTDQSLLDITKILNQEAPLVSKLRLAGNEMIGAEGLRELGEALSVNTSLLVLDIGGIRNHFTGCWYCFLVSLFLSFFDNFEEFFGSFGRFYSEIMNP